MTKRETLLVDLLIVIAIPIIAIPFILYFRVKPLTSALFFFVLPSLYLLIRKPVRVKRILTGSFLIGVVLGLIFDFLSVYNSSWFVPTNQLWIPYRFLGFLPVDEPIWFFFWAMSILTFYEHFVEHERSDKISHNYKYALFPGLITLVGVLFVYSIDPEVLKFSYTYFRLQIIALILPLYVAIKQPSLIYKFFKVSAYFFFLYLIYELSALHLGQWSFPAQAIGWVSLFGLSFPFEEFFFWILISSTTVLAYYEEFVDDQT